MFIDDNLMEVLVRSFTSAAKGKVILPDGTRAEEVRVEDGIRAVIKAYLSLTPKPIDVQAPTTNFNRYR